MSKDAHLTPGEVEAILKFVRDFDPIIVGGQSINIWAEIYRGQNHELDALSPLTSKDIDFYHNLQAEEALADALRNGEIRLPDMDDHTPEAAVVTGYLGDKKITVDFMASILGVNDTKIESRSITYTDPEKTEVSVTLMHPLDCVRSRLSNINTLSRSDEHAVTQARASLIILDCFIDSQLAVGEKGSTRHATRALLEIGDIIFTHHTGKPSETQFGDVLNLRKILEKYQSDDRLDMRFREHQLRQLLA